MCLVGNLLDQLLAPGDVLVVRGQGRLSEIGAAGGFLGHVLLLQAVWPPGGCEQLWRVITVESTRRERGLHQAEMLVYVEPRSCRLILVGEISQDDELNILDHEAMEVWQSPIELRAQLRLDLVAAVLVDMKKHEANWSLRTAARAVLKSAVLVDRADKALLMKQVKASWRRDPICTSVVIVFWQRYLCKLAEASNSNGLPGCSVKPTDLILRWMPVRADRGLPG
eukprot:CAMPEP_0180711860 /NCGR_PEP_ID=MMETSP1038_2-20121128/11076_1 /TAXON_ID=632150 /ORGANISM="Azadinium spinosum, Strain 3D9" /LENGTH=224 /DNA_ID=CAMNT_0022744111 /DNA_START=73 /DNA_END=744 /DNA_ORIENTATION=+